MRCYDPEDRNRIVRIFEQAATLSSSFCFSTTITMPNGYRQPLFCMGESNGYEDAGMRQHARHVHLPASSWKPALRCKRIRRQ
jgi:hypothetical protein